MAKDKGAGYVSRERLIEMIEQARTKEEYEWLLVNYRPVILEALRRMD